MKNSTAASVPTLPVTVLSGFPGAGTTMFYPFPSWSLTGR